MALRHKTRRALSLVVLFIGLPVYIGFALWLVSLFDRPGTIVELLLYVVLGTVWIFPVRFIFLGVGKEDPDP